MKIFEANITLLAKNFFARELAVITTLENANKILKQVTGIEAFFQNISELNEIKEKSSFNSYAIAEPERPEYGDFQTNLNLAEQIIKRLNIKGVSPDVIVEPTCGKGNFILASLNNYCCIKKIVCIEIYRPYVWETKFNILDFFLAHLDYMRPEIEIIHNDVFSYDFKTLAKSLKGYKVLVLGNPPWVTNAKLGSLRSDNLPFKTNFKRQNGLDAITGKANFDIAEYILLSLLDAFQNYDGNIAFLIKNSVIKSIIFNQRSKSYRIGEMSKYSIDSKKEFNVSVESSLFFCRLNTNPGFICLEYDFYNSKMKSAFGWADDNKYVSDLNAYQNIKEFDGICPFVWRQGIKHDCSSVMELEKIDNHFVNKSGEIVIIEDKLVYGLLKSSDLKNTVIENTRKYIIVTQKRIGQETDYIKYHYPMTYEYLNLHKTEFQARKSSIYKGKPMFSVFGIGDYSFKPYKLSISGLYKTFHFTLVLPQGGKPVMLDDTCYFIGFEEIEYAVFALIVLNSPQTKELLQSISFNDAKRVFTKDILMRIDILKIGKIFPEKYINKQLSSINNRYKLDVDISLWKNFINFMTPPDNNELPLFCNNNYL